MDIKSRTNETVRMTGRPRIRLCTRADSCRASAQVALVDVTDFTRRGNRYGGFIIFHRGTHLGPASRPTKAEGRHLRHTTQSVPTLSSSPTGSQHRFIAADNGRCNYRSDAGLRQRWRTGL